MQNIESDCHVIKMNFSLVKKILQVQKLLSLEK
jgi:hypothetical protein